MGKVSREEMAGIFKDTMHLCETNRTLMDSVLLSRKHQKVIAKDLEIPDLPHKDGTPAKVLASKKRSLEAARQYIGMKVCVLNFASATNPGGALQKAQMHRKRRSAGAAPNRGHGTADFS